MRRTGTLLRRRAQHRRDRVARHDARRRQHPVGRAARQRHRRRHRDGRGAAAAASGANAARRPARRRRRRRRRDAEPRGRALRLVLPLLLREARRLLRLLARARLLLGARRQRRRREHRRQVGLLALALRRRAPRRLHRDLELARRLERALQLGLLLRGVARRSARGAVRARARRRLLRAAASAADGRRIEAAAPRAVTEPRRRRLWNRGCRLWQQLLLLRYRHVDQEDASWAHAGRDDRLEARALRGRKLYLHARRHAVRHLDADALHARRWARRRGAWHLLCLRLLRAAGVLRARWRRRVHVGRRSRAAGRVRLEGDGACAAGPLLAEPAHRAAARTVRV